MNARRAFSITSGLVLLSSNLSCSKSQFSNPQVAPEYRPPQPRLATKDRKAAAKMPSTSFVAQGGDVGLTISGGISLGAYEAGANWAVVEYIKRTQAKPKGPRLNLKVVTGASAGNINTLLTAVHYCQGFEDYQSYHKSKEPVLSGEKTPSGVNNNVYWNTWTPIGFNGLHPRDLTCEEFENNLAATWRAYGWTPELRAQASSDSDSSCRDPDGDGFTKSDGLLSRRTFNYAVELLQEKMDEDQFRENCDVALGMTVTAVKPIEASGSLKTKRATFSSLIEARTNAKHGFELWSLDEETIHPPIVRQANEPGIRLPVEFLIGDRIYFPLAEGLPPNKTMQAPLSSSEVFDLVQASSAFPGAFSPVPLDVCLKEELTRGHCLRDGNLTNREGPRRRMFFDGGVFDNLPIGLALPLMFRGSPPPPNNETAVKGDSIAGVSPEPAPEGPVESATPAHENTATSPPRILLYLEPDQRRDAAPSRLSTVAGHKSPRGLGQLLPLVGDLVEVGRTRELQRAGELQKHFFQGGDANVTLEAITRGGGVYGEHLGAFGAFAALPMREYDFLVGIYDGMYKMALLECTPLPNTPLKNKKVPKAACVARSVREQSAALGLEHSLDGAAAYVARKMLANDLYRMSKSQDTRLSVRDEEICWLDGYIKASRENGVLSCIEPLTVTDPIKCYRAAFFEDPGDPACTLEGTKPRDWEELGISQLELTPEERVSSFQELVERLPYNSSNVPSLSGIIPEREKEIFDSYPDFERGLIFSGLDRMIDVERKDKKNGAGGAGKRVFKAASAVANIYYRSIDPKGFQYSSSIPSFNSWQAYTSLLLPFHASVRTASGGGEFGYRFAYLWRHAGVALQYSPVTWARERHELSMKSGPSLVVPLHNVLIPQIEAGPNASWLYAPGRSDYKWRGGAEVALYLIANRFRLAYSWEKIVDGQLRGNVQEFTVGLADFNGLYFWALGGSRR